MSPEQFGHTWWGKAWVRALEQGAALDPNRLPRGRTYARQDRVTSLSLEPGLIAASVRGSRRLNYRTHLAVVTYDDQQWETVIATIAAHAGHMAAVLDGEVDPGIVDDVRQAGVELLPRRGDLRPRCSCPDDAKTCKHVAAVAYLVAEVLDDDPFMLFALRGRPRDVLLDQLRRHRREANPDRGSSLDPMAELDRALEGPGPDPGEAARAAWQRERAPLPTLAELPNAPGAPAAWPSEPPDDAPFDAPGLLTLAGDAAQRAWTQLRGDGSSALSLGQDADVVRRAAGTDDQAGPGSAMSSVPPDRDLTHRATAWRHGGEAGLAMLGEAAWRPPVATMAAARAAITEAGVSPSVLTVNNNRITGPGFQLRLSRSGSWWRFEKHKNRWEIVAPPAESADDLLSPS